MRIIFTALVTALVVIMLFFLSPLLQETANRMRRKAYQWQLGLLARTMGATMTPAGTAISILDRPGGFHFQTQFTLDAGSIAAGGREIETVAIPGLAVGDLAIVRNRTARALIPTAERVSAPGALEFALENNTAGAIDAGADVYDCYIIRGSSGPLR